MRINKLGVYISSLAMMAVMTVGCSNLDEPNFPERHDIMLADTQKSQIERANNTALEIWKQLASNGSDNQVFSPISIQMALSMLANGVEDDVMNKILLLYGEKTGNDGLEELNTLNQTLIAQFPQVDTSVKSVLANSVWAAYNNKFTDTYTDAVKTYYGGEVFTSSSESAIDIDLLNKWISDKTGGLIPTMIEGQPMSDIMLVNASYFKGAWREKFDKSKTREGKFTNADGSVVKVDMMVNDDVSLVSGMMEKYKFAILPYGNKGYQMYVVLPNEGVSITDCDITPILSEGNKYSQWNVRLSMPRFSLEYHIDDIWSLMSAVGLDKVMYQNVELKKMLGEEGKYLLGAIQKTKISVDEDGTTAASSTVVEGLLDAGIFDFILDRPFIYFIREESTGAILYMGNVTHL